MNITIKFFGFTRPYQALPGLTGLDRPEAVGALERWSVFVFSCRLSRCWSAERAVLARATCSHNVPLLTDKVSKCARAHQPKIFGGRHLWEIDSVKEVSIAT